MNKPRTLLSVVMIFMAFNIPYVLADGCIIIPEDEDMGGWGFYPEKSQRAAISYGTGMEKMLIEVEIEKAEENLVWIFPVPSQPEDISIDIMDGFPYLEGRDIMSKKDGDISNAFNIMRVSQYPSSALFLPLLMFSALSPESLEEGVDIHSSIEKLGLRTEVVTAKDGESFYRYIEDKGMLLPEKSKEIFGEYIGNDYSFIVSEPTSEGISYQKALEDAYRRSYDEYYLNPVALSVFVQFPSEKMYFPLKLTSVYNGTVPISIYVKGYVTPDIFYGIKEDTSIRYFLQKEYRDYPEFVSFFSNGEIIKDLNYTKIKIDAPANNLIEDLWIRDEVPFETKTAELISGYVWLCAVPVFLLLSCLSSLIAGIVVFGRKVSDKKRLFLIGLSNIFTVIGLSAFVYSKGVLKSDSKKKPQKGFGATIRYSFLAGLAISAVILLLIFFSLLLINLGSLSSFFDYGYVSSMSVLGGIVAIIFSIGVFPFALAYCRNKKSLYFVLLFSVIFLVLSGIFQILFHMI